MKRDGGMNDIVKLTPPVNKLKLFDGFGIFGGEKARAINKAK